MTQDRDDDIDKNLNHIKENLEMLREDIGNDVNDNISGLFSVIQHYSVKAKMFETDYNKIEIENAKLGFLVQKVEDKNAILSATADDQAERIQSIEREVEEQEGAVKNAILDEQKLIDAFVESIDMGEVDKRLLRMAGDPLAFLVSFLRNKK